MTPPRVRVSTRINADRTIQLRVLEHDFGAFTYDGIMKFAAQVQTGKTALTGDQKGLKAVATEIKRQARDAKNKGLID